MSSTQILVLGAIAGFTIFLGLPAGRMDRLPVAASAFVAAIAVSKAFANGQGGEPDPAGNATLALEGNVNVELVRRKLGHSQVAMTVDLYQRHRVETAERVAAETISSLIDDAPRRSCNRTCG